MTDSNPISDIFKTGNNESTVVFRKSMGNEIIRLNGNLVSAKYFPEEQQTSLTFQKTNKYELGTHLVTNVTQSDHDKFAEVLHQYLYGNAFVEKL